MAIKEEFFLFYKRRSPVLLLLFFLLITLWASERVWVFPAWAQERLERPLVDLHGVSFLSKEEGWVVGQLGKIFHTVDGGNSWKQQDIGTNLLLTAVDFVDRTHGWVVGERGVILHTRDGGSTWEPQQSNVLYPLFDVEFLNQERGWVVGHWGLILVTEDGGKHWREQSLSLALEERGLVEPAALHDVVDPKTEEVVAKAEQLLSQELIAEISRRGIDDVRIREDVVLNTIFFLDRVHGWIAGERGVVLRTEDGGESWERMIFPRPLAHDQETGEKEMMSEEELAAFGVVTPPPSLYGIFFVSPLQGWVVGQDGTIARTYDGGRQWEFQLSGTTEALYDIGVVGNEGWIVGDKGTVLVSTDGGLWWGKKDLGLEYRLSWLRRLSVVSGDHAFMVGADGLVLTSGKSSEHGLWIQKSKN